MSHAPSRHQKLGQFLSTAMCGNDIMSSALYVSGIAAIFAGIYAPLVLFIVAIVLFFYRTVYREVVEALPVNGGAYNALLNATSKTFAALAGIMTILSYIATAVISAKTGVAYLFKFFETLFPLLQVPISAQQLQTWLIPTVILVLFLFALLVINGVKDSARVAAGIFVLHIVTLTVFIVFGGAMAYLLYTHTDLGTINTLATQAIIQKNHGSLFMTLYLAFSACLLGVSGFESSANFVEEQAPGVFRKTLRNMTIGVMVFNPLIAFVCLKLLSIPEIVGAKDFVLAEAAMKIGGLPLLALVSINAFLVLCGAVLTGYIGVSGLAYRMALDDCLPSIIRTKSKRGSHPRIVLLFFALCSSILIVTKGDLLSLAGVYTISFLGVMSLFAIGNLILRRNRPELKRTYHAPLLFVLIAMCSTLIGLMGNIALDPKNTVYFLTYFIPAVAIVFAILFKKDLLRTLKNTLWFTGPLARFIERKYERTVSSRFYVFIHHTTNLFRALDYIDKNENGHRVTIVHCSQGDKGQHEDIRAAIPYLEKAGVLPHFDVHFEYLNAKFSPTTIDRYAKKFHIPKNKIFIGSIHTHHEYNYSDFGGVRIIL